MENTKVEQGQERKLLAMLNRVIRLSLIEKVKSEQRFGIGKKVCQAGAWIKMFWTNRSARADSLRQKRAWYVLRTATMSVWLEWNKQESRK